MPRWIQDIQGYTTVLDENGDPVLRRAAFQVVGASVTDNGTNTVITVPAGPTGATGAADPAATYDWSGNHSFGAAVMLDGIYADGAVTGNLADVAIGAVNMARFITSSGGPHTLSGMVPAANGQLVWIENADSADGLILAHDATSTATNRFVISGLRDLFLPPRTGVWARYDSTSSRWFISAPLPSGTLLRAPQVLTGGTSINHPTGTRLIKVRGVGGGAAGGGSAATAYTGGGCGGSGTYGERTFTASSLTSTYTIGAGGTGAANAEGTDGGDSTFTHGATTVTLPGGSNSSSRITAAAGSADNAAGGPGGGAATNADVSVPGEDGGSLIRDAANPPGQRFYDGGGGSTPLGRGGRAVAVAPGSTTNIVASAGTGFGSGGSGRCNGSSVTPFAGGDGRPGVWIVEEYS